jgi:hypothetical protein
MITAAAVTAEWIDTDPKATVTFTTQAIVDAFDAALAADDAEGVLAAWAAATTTPGPVMF